MKMMQMARKRLKNISILELNQEAMQIKNWTPYDRIALALSPHGSNGENIYIYIYMYIYIYVYIYICIY